MTFYRPSIIEDIRIKTQKTSTEERSQNAQRTVMLRDPEKQLFNIKPADQWLTEECSRPAARQLLGSLWYEQELCILFADTNVGKSILAVQIGYQLAKQSPMHPFGCEVNESLRILYIDFELNAAQFRIRYTHPEHGQHHFGDNFIRAEFNPGGDDPFLYDKYDDYVKEKIEKAIIQSKASVLIIDNITCMGSQTSHAAGALPLMKTLKALKTKHRLSMLVLAHTPKRNQCAPITVNDLQGSKMLINFADSAFSIGQSSRDINLRYIKQIKQRNAAGDYGADQVVVFNLSKQQSFLSFQFAGFNTEAAHLQKPGVSINSEIKQRIPQLIQQGLSQRQVADHLKISLSTVKRVVARAKSD
ncbi:MAG TPA: AAA family ATPase [Mucilaginibacter sp.]|jgi:predicted XRE-type DNA-binding protein